jgi:hypothetical protein
MFFVFIIFEIIIGQRINRFHEKIDTFTSDRSRDELILKIKNEIKKANQKENYLSPEDRELLSTFIRKIQKELSIEKTE